MKRHFMASIVCIGILMAGSGLYNPTWAQDIDLEAEIPAMTEAEEKTTVSVGLGPGIAPDYEGSSDYYAVPIPFLSVRFSNNMSIEWLANTARADIIPSRTWTCSNTSRKETMWITTKWISWTVWMLQ